MADYAMDLTTGRLILAKNDLTFVTGLAAVKQSWVIRIRTFAREWALDPSLGWLDFNDPNGPFARQPNLAVIKSRVRAITLATPGMLTCGPITITTDRLANPPQRSITVNDCTATDGPLDLSTTVT